MTFLCSDVHPEEVTYTILEMRQRDSLKIRLVVNHCLAAPGHLRPCQPVNQSLRLSKKRERQSTGVAQINRRRDQMRETEGEKIEKKKWNRKWSGQCNRLQYMTSLKHLLLVVPMGLFLFPTHYSKSAMLSWRLPRHCARISRAVVDSESISSTYRR